MHVFSSRLYSMLRREDGSIAATSGLLMTLMVPTIIAAVDLTNISKTREEVQAHLDGALIAATKFDNLTEANDSGKLHDRGHRFLFNSLRSADIATENAETSFEYDTGANVMRGSVEIVAPTIFTGRILGIDRLVVTSEVVPREKIELEVALSIDVSGSMAWAIDSDTPTTVGSRRIDALQEGVRSLASVFDNNRLVDARISVIPYSSSVNIATTTEVIGGGDAATPADMTTINGIAPDGSAGSNPIWAAERAERSGNGKMQISAKPPKESKKTPLKAVGTPKAPVLPLSDTQAAATYISTVEPEGGTAGHIGAEWAFYSLLPKWQDVWEHPGKAPGELNSATRKVIVIITDGDFTVTQTEGLTIDDAYEAFQNTCKTAREAGIMVYTIGLKVSAMTDAELTRCAGAEDNHFPVGDRTAIADAFTQIAEKATRLRISK